VLLLDSSTLCSHGGLPTCQVSSTASWGYCAINYKEPKHAAPTKSVCQCGTYKGGDGRPTSAVVAAAATAATAFLF